MTPSFLGAEVPADLHLHMISTNIKMFKVYYDKDILSSNTRTVSTEPRNPEKDKKVPKIVTAIMILFVKQVHHQISKREGYLATVEKRELYSKLADGHTIGGKRGMAKRKRGKSVEDPT